MAEDPKVGELYTHRQRGGKYKVVMIGSLEWTLDKIMVCYVCLETGKGYIRPLNIEDKISPRSSAWNELTKEEEVRFIKINT